MSQNKVKYGLEKVHVAFWDAETATPEVPAWQAPKEIKGAVNFSASPEGDDSEFYADNTKYFSHSQNNGYTGDLEVANIPDDILAEMLGMTVDDNGMLVESTEDKQKEFALMFEVTGDEKNRRTVYYRCKANRPDEENSTSESSADPTTDNLPIEMLPTETDEKYVKSVMELSDTNQVAYDAFFEDVTLPELTAL
jgi:phi13 family phage major tail protein